MDTYSHAKQQTCRFAHSDEAAAPEKDSPRKMTDIQTIVIMVIDNNINNNNNNNNSSKIIMIITVTVIIIKIMMITVVIPLWLQFMENGSIVC